MYLVIILTTTTILFIGIIIKNAFFEGESIHSKYPNKYTTSVWSEKHGYVMPIEPPKQVEVVRGD